VDQLAINEPITDLTDDGPVMLMLHAVLFVLYVSSKFRQYLLFIPVMTL